MRSIFLTTFLFILYSCGSDDSSGGGNTNYTGTFSDTAITNFTQTSGIAKTNPNKALELLIPTSYAATGNISCIIGESVSFSIDTTIGSVSNTTDVDTTCSNSIDLSIRRGLLESLKDLALYRTVTDASYKNGLWNLISSGPNAGSYSYGFVWNLPYQIKTLATPCFDLYTFDKDSGLVEIKPDFTNNGGSCLCNDSDMGNPSHPSYNSDCRTVSASFRFLGGSMELDLTGANNFDSSLSTYEKWEQCSSLADSSTCN